MKHFSKLILLVIVSFLFSCKTNTIKDGEDIIHAMYNTYNGKSFRSIAFEQTVTYYTPEKKDSTEVWLEVYKFPNRLHIRKQSFESGDGMIFCNDSVYYFKNNVLQEKHAQIHYLVLLSLDAYSQEPAITIQKLKKCNFDLSKMRTERWNGRETYVIGALEGDTSSNQFWIDKEHLYFVRSIFKRDTGVLREIRFANFCMLEDSWVEQEVLFMLNSKLEMKEDYYNLRIPENISDSCFIPSCFSTARW